jgi:hypothetical protein
MSVAIAEPRAAAAAAPEQAVPTAGALVAYLLLGTLFGIVLVKAEIVLWFRIQEMFRFGSFHMYGILGSAIAVAAAAIELVRRARPRALDGSVISIPSKVLGRGHRYWLGGAAFGLGWALVGACPGPLFALVGAGASVMLVALAGALAGTLLYGWARPRLPH